jgi:hypothetical protein
MTDVPLCTCGYEQTEQESVADHLGEQFIPRDDTAPDGRRHTEAARDEATIGWPCVCGFTASDFPALDAHLLAVFTPTDAIGADGQTHVLAEE